MQNEFNNLNQNVNIRNTRNVYEYNEFNKKKKVNTGIPCICGCLKFKKLMYKIYRYYAILLTFFLYNNPFNCSFLKYKKEFVKFFVSFVLKEISPFSHSYEKLTYNKVFLF